MQRSADRQLKVLSRTERDRNELATQKAQADQTIVEYEEEVKECKLKQRYP